VDPKQFEVLSRRVGAAATRRGALKVLAGGVGASVLALLRANAGGAQVDPENLPHNLPIVHCRVTLQSCHDDRQCCSGRCGKKVTLEPAPEPIEVPLPAVEVPLPDPLEPVEVQLPDAEIPLPDEFEGVCDCRPKGDTCYTLLEGAFCCSGRCGSDAKCQ
jgi:hypothetical protein